MKYLLFFFLVIYIGITPLYGQCRLDTNVIINKTDTIDLPIRVVGVSNNDLSDPLQGLCEVQIKFEHVYIGDVLMWLISPSGQQIQLIGDEVMAGFTFGQVWDISFVPNSVLAKPDMGFNPKWTNDQNWAVGGTGGYKGSYYPYANALESFNIGAVNGRWTLHVEDRSRFYSGKIMSVALIFCDDVGSDCSPCMPHEVVIINNDIEACQGDPSLAFKLDLGINRGQDTTDLYSDTLLLLKEDEILNYLDTPNISLMSLPAGSYQICGISYYKKHKSKLPIVGSDQWTTWVDNLDKGVNLICGSVIKNCMNIRIYPLPDTVLVEDLFCKDGDYQWGDTLITDPGIFKRVIPSVLGGCDSIVVLTLKEVIIEAEIIIPDTLTCSGDSVLLDGSRSIIGKNTSWKWVAYDLGIELASKNEFQNIGGIGKYKLVLSEGSCYDTAFVEVFQDTSLPVFFVSTDTLSCLKDSVCLVVRDGGNTNYSYNWQSKGVSISIMKDICVKDTGIYTLTVKALNGCSVDRKVKVQGDYQVPRAEWKMDSITCLNDTAYIVLLNPTLFSDYYWLDEMGVKRHSKEIKIVKEAKIYLYLTATNGCSRVDSFIVRDVRKRVVGNLDIDTLTCITKFVYPQLFVNTSVAKFRWNGPGGFDSFDQIPKINTSGIYTIRVEDESGCTWDSTFVISIDTILPKVSFEVDTITCTKDTAKVKFIGDPKGLNFHWINQRGFEVFEVEPSLPDVGEYFIITTGLNGCVVIDTVEVFGDTLLPIIHLDAAHLSFNCFVEDSILIRASSQLAKATFEWISEGRIIDDKSSIYVKSPGWYHVEVSGSLDCVANDSIFIGIDTIPPLFNIEGKDSLDCNSPSAIWQINTSNNPIFNLFHNGSVQMVEDSFEINREGNYTLTAKGSNHCESKIDFSVTLDTLSPAIKVVADTINCFRDKIPLLFTSNTLIDSFVWKTEGVTVKKDSVTDVGIYIIRAYGKNGCWAESKLNIIEDKEPPRFSVEGGMLTCIQDSIVFNTHIATNFSSVEWRFNNVIVGDSIGVKFGKAGRYLLTVVGQNGCVNDTSIVITIDTVRPSFMIEQKDSLNCFTNASLLNLSIQNGPSDSWKYNWSTPNGNIVSGVNFDDLKVDSAGVYSVLVVNEMNGCFREKQITVIDQRVYPDSVNIDAQGLFCEGENDGMISLKNIYGGSGTFLVNFDNQGYNNNRNWQDLKQGKYVLEVRSDNGCVYDTVATINEPPEWDVNAGPDKEIYLGQSIMLDAKTNIPPSEIQSILWLNDQSLSCNDCIVPTADPIQDETYEIIIITEQGCELRDEVTVKIIEGLNIYIPNTFSPNGDGINDQLKVFLFPKAAMSIKGGIYSRWGERIVSFSSNSPIEEMSIWDGIFRAQNMPPGVYVYWVEVVLPSKKTLMQKGSITLVR